MSDFTDMYTRAINAEERAKELEATIAELKEAARDLVANVRRGTPIDISAVETQLALAEALAALIKEKE